MAAVRGHGGAARAVLEAAVVRLGAGAVDADALRLSREPVVEEDVLGGVGVVGDEVRGVLTGTRPGVRLR